MPPNHRQTVCWAFDEWFEKNKGTLPQNPLLLDIGCRDTALKPYFQEKGFEWRGCDIEEEKGVTQVDMTIMTGVSWNRYDVAFLCHSFEHCERPIDALRAIKRVLKPGGWIWIGGPNPCAKQIELGDDDHIFVLNPQQMRKLLTYTEFGEPNSYLQMANIKKEQDYNVITWGTKAPPQGFSTPNRQPTPARPRHP